MMTRKNNVAMREINDKGHDNSVVIIGISLCLQME